MMLELATDDTGTGPAVILLHAFPCNRRMWQGQVSALSEAGLRVLAPDLPGFGESPVPEAAPDLAVSAQAVFDLMDDRAIGSASVAGLSMGGYVLMEMLRQQPGRIDRIALVDTKSGLDPEPARENRFTVAEQVLADGSSEVLQQMLPKLLGATTLASRPDVVDEVRSFIAAAPPAAVAWAQRAMAGRHDAAGTLASFDRPALVCFGTEDALSPEPDQTIMSEALPQVRVERIDECGHLSALEQPDALAALLADFFSS